MYKKLQDIDVTNKKVVIRLDYNVPMKDGNILDDFKIVQSLDTLKYLMEKNCKIVILSHLGKVKSEKDKVTNTLEPVAKRLKELLKSNVIFAKQNDAEELHGLVDKLNPKDIVLLENTRTQDFPEKKESKCDMELAKFWASLGEVFVFDAFGSSHRRHSSTYGISKYLPTCIGLLVQKELEMLNKYVINAEHPFTIIMGGAKIDDKIELMNKLLPKCDHMLLTGGIANTCLATIGFQTGNSLKSKDIDIINQVKTMLVTYKNKILLPFDVIVGNTYNDEYIAQKNIIAVDTNEEIKDIGIKTINIYKDIINQSKSIFVNGTAGLYEDNRFANGTRELLDVLSKSLANVIVGGGDSASAARNMNYADKFSFVSTGGGATLEYIIKEKLDALDDEEENNSEIEIL